MGVQLQQSSTLRELCFPQARRAAQFGQRTQKISVREDFARISHGSELNAQARREGDQLPVRRSLGEGGRDEG
jgi:hypothetical protein